MTEEVISLEEWKKKKRQKLLLDKLKSDGFLTEESEKEVDEKETDSRNPKE